MFLSLNLQTDTNFNANHLDSVSTFYFPDLRHGKETVKKPFGCQVKLPSMPILLMAFSL